MDIMEEIKFVDGAAGVLVKKVKCDFKKLGPKFGKQMKAVAAAVAGMSQEAIAELEKNGSYTFQLDGADAVVEAADVEIFSEDIPGWLVANEGKLTVALEVTVTEELENIETYFAIQQFRFGERLRLEIDDPEPGIQHCQIPKLTMQPLVENAIIHGLERKMGIGVVSVRLTLTEKRLIVRISDNGVGMEPETLHQLQKELCRTAYDYIDSGRGTGIALLNVNNRIRLLFGEQYGITICSTPGLGTDVTVTLPAKHEGRA